MGLSPASAREAILVGGGTYPPVPYVQRARFRSLIPILHPPMTTLPLAALLFVSSPGSLDTEAERLLNVSEVSVQHLAAPVLPAHGTQIAVDFDGLPFHLELWPHSVRDANFRLFEDAGRGLVERAPQDPRTVRGIALEDPGSTVAGSLLDDGLHAKIMLSSGDTYWIEPLYGKLGSAAPGQHAVYHQGDVLASYGVCGTESLAADSTDDPPMTTPATAYIRIAELGTDADYEFFTNFGSVQGVLDRIELIVNTLNTQYEDEVRLRHELAHQIVRTSPGAGGLTSFDPSTLLSQFRAEWINNQQGQPRDVAVLFTGKNLNGSVIGIAYPSSICTGGYNVSQTDCCGNMACKTDLVAHELGHNWSSGHCSCSGNTMNPSITCSNTFHEEFTRPKIMSFANSRNCLEADVNGDVLYEFGFEGGGFGGWAISDTGRVKVRTAAAAYGNYGVKLKKGGQGTGACTFGTLETWAEAPGVDTTGYSGVTVMYDGHVRNNELGCEFMYLQMWDGGNWVTVHQIDQHSWATYTVTLPSSAAGQSNLRLRFITNCKGLQERGEFDSFTVIGN